MIFGFGKVLGCIGVGFEVMFSEILDMFGFFGCMMMIGFSSLFVFLCLCLILMIWVMEEVGVNVMLIIVILFFFIGVVVVYMGVNLL